MKLSILIATQGRRNPKLRILLKKLMRQVRKYKGEIEVVAYWNNGELPIGAIRQALLDKATGEYVCFIDDDDDIPDYYCDEIMRNLGCDYVGFQVKLFSDDVEQKPAYHQLRYSIWDEDEKGFYRGITHLNPIRRRIANHGSFSLNGAAEDADWSRSLIGYCASERYIDKVMYFYHHDMNDTSFGGNAVYRVSGYRRPVITYQFFRWHPDSKLVSKEVENDPNYRM